MALALKCQNLNKSFDGIHALADVSIRFPNTGCVGIIGPNGAGKSTLLNVASGFVRPDSGSCFLGEENITSKKPHQIVRAGMARTFQEIRLIGRLTVLENVLLARPNQRGEKLLNCLFRNSSPAQETDNIQCAEHLLEIAGLIEKSGEHASDLSYGQQKLLSICCCVATDASVLFLDEPVAGIHPDAAERISDYVAGIARAGRLVIFIEHDIGMVRRTANHVIVMDAGRVIADGAPHDVLERQDILQAYIS
jgi:branched-chain amino acid transport system permease protein